MEKFEFEDYLNYTISGILWIVGIWFLISEMSEMKFPNFQKLQMDTAGAIVLFFSGYTVGNIMRPTHEIIKKISEKIWGDFYEQALYKSYYEEEGILKLYSLKGNTSKKIKKNLEKLDMIRLGKEKVEEIKKLQKSSEEQYLLMETYIELKQIPSKRNRVKNLMNFFESIHLPINLMWFNLTIYFLNRTSLITKSEEEILIPVELFFIFLGFFSTNYLMLDRYKYLKSNLIKETYRIFFYESIDV